MYDFLVKIFMMSEMRIYTKIVAIYAFYAALWINTHARIYIWDTVFARTSTYNGNRNWFWHVWRLWYNIGNMCGWVIIIFFLKNFFFCETRPLRKHQKPTKHQKTLCSHLVLMFICRIDAVWICFRAYLSDYLLSLASR